MAGATDIEWATKVWNPVAGCSVVSPGCTNCYAMKMAARVEAMAAGSGRTSAYDGLTRKTKAGAVWTGEIRVVEDALLLPLRWKKPERIFVNSMSDLFHLSVPDDVVERVLAVAALAPQHTYLILTKRPDRMRRFMAGLEEGGVFHDGVRGALVEGQAQAIYSKLHGGEDPSMWLAVHLPLPNVILGCSVEDQTRADERRAPMAELAADGWATFVSYEPALGGVDWTGWEFLRWLISGGESGPGARPHHPDWHRWARDFCARWGIAYFFKQWGAWKALQGGAGDWPTDKGSFIRLAVDGGRTPDGWPLQRVGKAFAGRDLDGRTHDQFPQLAEVA